MKTDQLNLGQLMRYGFCGFFLCLAFVYGKGGATELTALLSKNDNNEALLGATFFASGAVFYSFYRAIVYPLLGRAAIFTVYQFDSILWERNRDVRPLRNNYRRFVIAAILLVLMPAITALLHTLSLRPLTLSFDVLPFLEVFTTLVLYLVILVLMLAALSVISLNQIWDFCRSKLALILIVFQTPKIELTLDIERWESKQREEGAQHLEEWASQVHLLYTTALSLALGSFTGAVWQFIHQKSWTDVQCSIPGALVIILLLLAAFASDCRRRHLEDHLRQHPLRMKRRAPR